MEKKEKKKKKRKDEKVRQNLPALKHFLHNFS